MQPRFIQTALPDPAAERASAIHDLLAPAARVSPKWFYDRLGSMLFEAITELPEYYPTRTEAAILSAAAPELLAWLGPVDTLVDLGAGNCAKAARLLPQVAPRRYLAVDISVDFLRDALQGLQQARPALEVIGLGLDFTRGLEIPAGLVDGRPLFFYPGSSIGNFEPESAYAFLRRVRQQADEGALLIGVDLVKPREVLECAYDDALGITAAFNLNLLRHLNAALGTDFDAAQWRHVALFSARESRIEMHLEARAGQVVRWPGGERRFAAGERICTEYSYKYDPADFEAMLRDAGFRRAQVRTDAAGAFAVFAARP